MTHRAASAYVLMSFLAAACGAPESTAPSANLPLSGSAAPEAPPTLADTSWNPAPLGAWLPVARDSMVDVQFEENGGRRGARVRSGERIVWINLRWDPGPSHLPEASGAITLHVDDDAVHDEALSAQIERLTQHYPVGIEAHSDVFEIPWTGVAMLDVDMLPDVRGFARLRVLRVRSSADLENLRGLDNLRKLALGIATVIGHQHLASLARLEELHLGDTRTRDEDLAALSGLAHLRRLKLGGNAITDAGLEHLRGLTALRSLDLGNTAITDDGLAVVATMTGLQELNLGGTMVTDAGLRHLRGLSELRRLDLPSTAVTSQGLRHLSGLVQLETLDLSSTRVRPDGLAHLAPLVRMHNLYLARVGSGDWDSGLAALRGMASLEELDLSGTLVGDAALAHLHTLTHLRELDLSRTSVSSAGLAALCPHLPRLLSLRLGGLRLESLEPLVGLRSLRRLDLGHAEVGEAALAPIARLGDLRDLELSYVQVSEAMLEAMGAAPRLTRIGLSTSGVSDEARSALRTRLSARQTGFDTQELSLRRRRRRRAF